MSLGANHNGFNMHSADIIDLAAERASLDIDPVLARLDRELVGLAPVKARAHQIASVLLVDRLRCRYGLTSSWPNLHMCFTGGPGTGKTTVALRLGELLKLLGYLDRGHLVTVTSDELVGQYSGRAAPKMKEMLDRSLGGVLFIDDASDLQSAEAIDILLQAMENDREEFIVILAGHKDQMDGFFQSNPDMSLAIAHHIDFPDFTADELCAIAEHMLADQGYTFSPGAREAFRLYLEQRLQQPRFANARSVRNALERALFRHANRLVSSGRRRCSRQDLMQIEPDDILACRVTTGART
jgi:probable Rubsico expression protein CbbX